KTDNLAEINNVKDTKTVSNKNNADSNVVPNTTNNTTHNTARNVTHNTARNTTSSDAATVNKDVDDSMDQCVAILNIALIAITDDISSEMTTRLIDQFLLYSNTNQKKAVPLALALLFTSFPKHNVVDVLSKLTHDQDPDVALHAILSLGFVGAGTNNSRIALLLRQLSGFYCKDSNAIFVVRLAQGLLYMGKGLLTINPLYSNRSIINPVALGSLIITIHACLQLRATILGKYHYLLFHLSPCIYPRMLFTVNDKLEPLPISVRVG
ncbi:26S proteasome regulatory subunit RPN1, putative, partial [Hepatocystis sp. ex Piliocolobus tephrosceles]